MKEILQEYLKRGHKLLRTIQVVFVGTLFIVTWDVYELVNTKTVGTRLFWSIMLFWMLTLAYRTWKLASMVRSGQRTIREEIKNL